MLSEDSQLNHEFFAGDPSKVEGGEDREVEGEGEGEGVVEEEGTSPPKAKKSRSQVRALDVQTPQVCFSIHRHDYIHEPDWSLLMTAKSSKYLMSRDCWPLECQIFEEQNLGTVHIGHENLAHKMHAQCIEGVLTGSLYPRKLYLQNV